MKEQAKVYEWQGERGEIEDIDVANRVIAELREVIAWVFTGNPRHAVTCDGRRLVATSIGWRDWDDEMARLAGQAAEMDDMLAQHLGVPVSVLNAMGGDPWLAKVGE